MKNSHTMIQYLWQQQLEAFISCMTLSVSHITELICGNVLPAKQVKLLSDIVSAKGVAGKAVVLQKAKPL